MPTELLSPEEEQKLRETEELERQYNQPAIDDSMRNTRSNRVEQLQKAGNFFQKNKKWFIGGGVGLGTLIPIVMFFFWMMAFKNVHIKNLYVTYRWAQFNRGLNRSLKAQLDYARKTPSANITGTADSTVSLTDTPDGIIKNADASKLGPEALNPDDTTKIEAEGKKITSVEQSIEGSSEKTLRESGANRTVKPAEGTGDTPEERAKSAREKARANIDDDISKNKSPNKAIPDTIKDGVDESKNQQESGKSATQAAEDGAAKILEGGGRWQSVVQKAGGAFVVATFYCIFRDIYVESKEQINKIALDGAMGTSQATNKVADCQKLGECDANQVGAMAEKYDNEEESFTQTCGYTRATQSSNPDCKEIDPQFVVDGLGKQVSGITGTALTTADMFLDPPRSNIPGVDIGTICSAVMNPYVQAGAAVVNLALIAGSGGGWGAVSQSVAGGAAAFAATAGGKALIASAILKYTGDSYKDLSPIDMGNLNDMGNMATAAGSCATAWCPQVSDAQVAQLDREYRTERIAANSKRSVFEKFFDTSSPDSVTSRVVLNTPVTPSAMVGKIKTVFASITNPARLSLALGNNSLAVAGVQSAYAADTGANVYGLSNKLTAPAPLLPGSSDYSAALAWGKNRDLSSFESKYSKCGGESGEAYHKRVSTDDGTCIWDNLDADGKMFFQYKYHQNVAYKAVIANNKQSSIGGSSSTAPSTGGASAVSGTRAELNARLLANPLLKLGNYQSATVQRGDIENGLVSDTLVRMMVSIVEQGKIALPINALKSDHRPGTLHGAGRAADIGYRSGDATGDTLFKYLYDNRAVLQLDELIWKDPPKGYKCLDGGEPVDCLDAFGAATMQAHASHVHVGVKL